MAKGSKKQPKIWVYSPPKPRKPKVTDDLKTEVTSRAEKLLKELKKQHIKGSHKGFDLNYIVDFYTKWFRNYFYFCAKYACPSPKAISPFFETRFARMEYVGDQRFNLSFMRYTGEWIELEEGLTLEKCMESIKSNEFYTP